MAALLVFIMATLEILFGQKNYRRKGPLGGDVFKTRCPKKITAYSFQINV